MTEPVYIASWGSIAQRHMTTGDQAARDVVVAALESSGVECRVVTEQSPPPADALKIWVSGPVDLSYAPQRAVLGDGSGWLLAGTTLITDRLAPTLCDTSTARDGPGVPTRGDLAALAPRETGGGFAAVMLRGAQPEYRHRADQADAIAQAVQHTLDKLGLWSLPIGTHQPAALTSGQMLTGIEKVLSAATVVITSRLHGVIFSLRAGRVPVVIDEVDGHGKITDLATAFGLPVYLDSPRCSVGEITEAIARVADCTDADASRILESISRSAQANLDAIVKAVSTGRGDGT